MMDVPGIPPVITPVVLPAMATAVVPELQTPSGVGLVSVTEKPGHTFNGPTGIAGSGLISMPFTI
jgi:hypothetical protein